jgi:NAD(P)-dependent dehydrogenase (short-subunit alcohol dehydrogenase family)
VLVTGGASGLGAALAAAFLERGDEVLIGDINEPSGFETVADAPSSTTGVPHWLRLDVRSDEDWASAHAWVTENWGGLDVLVNNAGVGGGGRVDVAALDEWQWITEINLFGVVRGTRMFAPMLKQQRSGQIVNIASLAGLVHPAGMGSYNAVKAGVVAFSETCAHELAEYGVRCSVVCPSYFRTNLIENTQALAPPGGDTAVTAVSAGLVADAPLGPEEIAAAVLEGVDRGEELILPDEAGRAAYQLKLSDRAAYDHVMRKQAARLNAMGSEPADATNTGR